MASRLPLPGSLTNFKGIDLLTNEQDQTKQQDQYRLYPHVRNQWTTFAYAEVDLSLVDNLIGQLEDKKFLNLIDNTHLSLIRGHFIINHHHIAPVIESIKENTSAYRQFSVCLSDLVVFKNENQSKCFLCLVDLNDIENDLNTAGLCKAIRNSLIQFDFKNNLNSNEQFNFHLSLAWCSIEHEEQLIRLIDHFRLNQLIEPVLIKVKEFKVHIGNQEYKFYLKK